MPIGRKTCDICAVMGAIAPVQQPWQPPVDAAAPSELASSAASWAGGYASRPSLNQDLEKAHKHVRRAVRYFAVYGGIAAGLGVAAEVFDWTAIQSIFNWFSAIEGGIFLVLAYLASRKSAVAIGIGAGLYFLDTLALLFSGHFSYLRLFILAVLIRSVLAANMLSKRAKTVAAPDQSRAA